MFKTNAKKTPTPPHWSLQVLTHDYLLEGQLKLGNEFVSAAEVLEDFLRLIHTQLTAAHGSLSFSLTSAQAQPAGRLSTPPQAFAELVVDFRNVIALIPHNDESAGALKKVFEGHKFPFATSFLAGPYLIRANLLSDNQWGSWDTTMFLPLAEARIESQLAEAKFAGLQAPWLLLNGVMVQAGGR